jgi:hypothetical protein
MIAIVTAALLLLALVDGACAGFRSSVGRTGLIDHRSSDHRAARRGAILLAILLTPAVVFTCIVTALDPASTGPYLRAGKIMLAIYSPCALAVFAGLAVYATLDWRKRYLASAAILGPFTLIRPAWIVVGAGLALAAGHNVTVTITAVLAVIGVLATEPLAGRLWYAPGTGE